MKRIFLSMIALLAVCTYSSAQYFFDDFDSYTADSFLGKQSTNWTTWSGINGGSDDVIVVNDSSFSGSNSLYFESANGAGPHDVILDFGGVHSSGTFKFSAMYYIPSGKGSYFNFQAGSTPGAQWAMEFYFYSGGIWSISGGGSKSGTFPHDQWFQLSIEANFDTDVWEVFVDGSSQGTFSNTLSISFLDLYEASAGSEWWMDDVSFCTNNGCNPELQIENLQISPTTVCTHHPADVSFKVTNNSTFPAAAMVLGIEVGNNQLTQGVNLNNLPGGSDTTITLSGFFNSTISGTSIPVAAINLQADLDSSNDTARTTIDVLPSPSMTAIIHGTPFESPDQNSLGTMANSDIVTAGDVLTYEITPPSGMNNSGYGSAWEITGLTFFTGSGAVLSSSFYSFTAATSSSNALISFSPDTSLLDSSISYSFAVSNKSNQCDSILSRYIKVVHRPEALFTQTNVCDKEEMSFTNNSSIPTGTMKYTWNFGDGVTTTKVNPTHTYSTDGQYRVVLYATSDYGYVDSMEVQVTVFELPVADFQVQNKCDGTALVFSDQSILPAGTPSYEWNFGDNSAKATGQNASHLYANTGTYSISLLVRINGCADSIIKFGTQMPRAIPDFSSEVNCNIRRAYFTNLSSVSSGNFGSLWRFGDGSEFSGFSVNHVYPMYGTYDVTLITTTDLGCADSITKSITLLESPKVEFSLNHGCAGEEIIMSNQTTTPAGGSNSYFWELGNGQTTTLENPSVTYPSPGFYTVKLVALNGNGCADSIMKKVKLDTKPLADFIAEAVCEGKTSYFVDKTLNIPDGASYAWDFGNGKGSAKKDTSFIYAATGTYTVTLTITTPNGCLDTVSKMVEVNPNADAGFSIESAKLGDGTMTFSADAGAPNTYLWFFGDGNQDSVQHATHKYDVVGTYNVKLEVTTDKGCVEKTTQSVNINPSGLAFDGKAIQAYPNPTRGGVILDLSELSSGQIDYVLRDGLGKILDQGLLKGGERNSLSLNNYPAGTYFIELLDGEERYRLKLSLIH